MPRQQSRPVETEPPLHIGSYQLEKVIGQGTYGKVRLAIHQETLEKVAIKVIEKAQIQSPKQVARLQREIRFLKLLDHPNIVKVIDVIETHDFIYIIMEYAVGGELFDYIVANKRVQEKEARGFFRMVLSAVDYCHKNAIIHRDLKPENLLLDEKKNIKIIDFGFGNNFALNGFLDTFCGSPFYAAPEMILGKKYEGPEVDMWSLGVILFALLCGHLPFDDDNMKELYKKIANGLYNCPDYVPKSNRENNLDARHLIDRLITVDPKKRATLEEVLHHPWINEGYDEIPLNYIPKRPIITDPNNLSKDITNRLEIFGYSKKEIINAFSDDQDIRKPNAIRATYFLLSEMIAREQLKLKKKKEREMGSSNTLQVQESTTSLASMQSNGTDIVSNNRPSEVKKSTGQRSISYHPDSKPEKLIQQMHQVSILDQRKGTRRQSVPLMIPNTHTKPSTTEKFKEELRAMSGWFLNFSTTTIKSPGEIMIQMKTILGEHFVAYSGENKYLIQSEVDSTANDWTCVDVTNDVKKRQMVGFQIEICKVPRMEMYAIHFKRLSGGVWNYKKVCNKIMSKMTL